MRHFVALTGRTCRVNDDCGLVSLGGGAEIFPHPPEAHGIVAWEHNWLFVLVVDLDGSHEQLAASITGVMLSSDHIRSRSVIM